jgi:hypothetical protein
MKINMKDSDYKSLVNMLDEVDKSSYDPVYKEMKERVESTKNSSKKNVSITLEEFEIYNILDGLNGHEEAMTSRNDMEKVKEISSLKNIINQETGLSL